MLRREPLGIGTSQLEATFAMLAEEGVPIGAIAPMMEALELYVIGSALHEAGAGTTKPDPKRAPHMAKAQAERALTADEVFDLVCEQIVATTVQVAREKEPAPAPKRNRRTA